MEVDDLLHRLKTREKKPFPVLYYVLKFLIKKVHQSRGSEKIT